MKRCTLLMLASFLLVLGIAPVEAEGGSAFDRNVIGAVRAGGKIVAQINGTAVVALLEAGEPVIALGLSGDYLRVRVRDGIGYIRQDAVKLDGDIASLQTVPGDLQADPLPADKPTADPAQYPIVPVIPGFTYAIYQRGQQLGARRAIFTKVGDCMSTETPLYLGPFAENTYDFGPYSSLQSVRDFYAQESPRPDAINSFILQSVAARDGYNASSVLDPDWLTSSLCKRGTTPLDCEYNTVHPAVAIIMFGTNDILSLSPAQYDFFLRLVVHKTIARGIIPILSTFPGYRSLPKRANQLNQIVYEVARDYQVPVMNLWLALQPLPNNGIDPTTSYLSLGASRKVTYFSEGYLKFGYAMRNLVVMQALDAVWRNVIQR